ncbi:MAG: capsule assembly Wzi family protein [Pseudomonadota bacterium]
MAMKPPAVLARVLATVAALLISGAGWAGPWVAPGNLALRHDIQVLADAGVITAPVTSWPLSWGDILNDIATYDRKEKLSLDQSAALLRVRRIGNQSVRLREINFSVDAKYDTEPSRLRGFEDRAREGVDVVIGAGWLGKTVAAEVQVGGVSRPDDDDDIRLDGSYVGVAIGNYMVSAGVMERWWGPGYDGSIILGNNHRPIPAVSIERNDTAPFKSPWLSWLGPWDASFVWGQLEDDRVVPNARYLGLRINFRPIQSLEIGLSRSAQWCGNGDRPCDLDTLVKLAIGQDNEGDNGVDLSSEPGNQLAGIDFRWAPDFAPLGGALYMQLIGEDEAGGLPSRFLGQLGVEISGSIRNIGYRAFAEFAGTTCQFYESSSRPNCGYNNAIYQTGYRYEGRSIGHSADNDAELFSIGGVGIEPDGDIWQGVVRLGQLNDSGPLDIRNTVSPTPADYLELEISHRKSLVFGEIEIGAGLSRFKDTLTGERQDDTRLFVGWRVPF